MKKTTGLLYAIYKNGIHKGNIRASSANKAIELYIMDSGLSHILDDKEKINQYFSIEAINGFHHHLIDKQFLK